ncbi:hypothetical protein ONS96_007109 [Cadophora gregata f. sp. sojae]|nr:hypothetical protein ONS96_007109 [Cadophora gregata f. sp. sojae]
MMAAAQVLVDALASLKNPDGTLQEGNRKLALGALISQLTHSETVDIRLRLNAMSTQGLPEKIPAELHHKILDYISLEDSMNLRLVRLNWSRKFSSVQTSAEIVKRHFTEKHELYTEELSGLEDDDRKLIAAKNLKIWLDNIVKQRLRRVRGQYASTSVYYYTETPATEQWGSPQYCNGRISYLSLDQMLVVKNICGEFTDRFALPQRELFNQWLLSDECIVAVSGNQRTIYAWQLELPFSTSQNEPQIQQLPNAIAKITARHNRVGIVLRHGEVYIWEIGRPKNPLSIVTLPWTTNLNRMNLLGSIVVFHPYRRDIFFIYSYTYKRSSRFPDSGTQVSQFDFYEYEDFKPKSRHTAYQRTVICNLHGLEPQISALQDTSIGISEFAGFQELVPKRDGQLSANLHVDEDNLFVHDTLVEIEREQTGSKGNLLESESALLSFDMETKQFQCHNYYRPWHNIDPGWNEPRTESLIWRNMTLSPVYRSDIAAESPPGKGRHSTWVSDQSVLISLLLGETDLLVTAVHHVPSPNKQASEISWYKEEQEGQTVVHRAELSAQFQQRKTAFHWVVSQDFTRAARNEVENDFDSRHRSEEVIPPRILKGDDRFVVLFGPKGYFVWCFDSDARLGIKDSEKDPTAQSN